MSAKTTVTISDDVKNVLRECEARPRECVLRLPPRTLDRKLYCDVKKVVEAAGGAWRGGKIAGFVFADCDSRQKVIDAANGSAEIVRDKVVKQAYYTPEDVARQLFEVAMNEFSVEEVQKGLRVLEPSCGTGSLIITALKMAPKYLRAVTVYDTDVAALEVCTDFLMQHQKKDKKFKWSGYSHDFLVTPAGSILADLVLINPPFANGAAKKHVAHARTMLQPGGVMAAIVPVNFPEDPGVKVYPVARGAFKESGTMVDTKIIVVKM